MENIEILDNILLSNSVCKSFHSEYENNKEFNKWINSVLPEIKDCYNNPQDNPWHIYNILDHILHSVEEMNKQTKNLNIKDRRLLAYTMFLHDIGKPKCKIRRMKNGVMIDSFFNHNVESSKIAKRVLPLFNFNEVAIRDICDLVYRHDVFINITLDTQDKYHKILTEKVLLDEINKFKNDDKYKYMKYLVMVGRSDNNAQNGVMTKEKIKLLNKIDEMLVALKSRRK